MTARYTPTAIALHWIIALGIAGTFVLGLYMHELQLSPTKLQLYSYHKWAGVTLFFLALIRLLWRLGHPAPALPDTMPPLMQKAAAAGHLALYALMFTIPFVGWVASSAKGFQTVWFGVIPLPDLVGKDKELGHLLGEMHEFLSYTLLVLVIGHVAAALKHHWIDKDDVLTRMLPHHGTR